MDNVMSITKKTNMNEIAEIINGMINDVTKIKENTKSMNESIETNSKNIKTIGNKFDGDSAKDSLKLNGHTAEDFIMKKDMIGLNTQQINSTEAELTISYNMTDGINKEVKVDKDLVIHFDMKEDQKTFAIPSSIVLLNIENKAEVTFKNIKFVDGVDMPVIEDNDYKMLVEIAYVGENWYIKNINVITIKE